MMPTQQRRRAADTGAAAARRPAAPAAKPRGRPVSRKPAPQELHPDASPLSAELAQAREQQAATSEILHLIARSPNDARPVFDAIAAAALQLCSGRSANVFTYDGELVHLVATAQTDPRVLETIRSAFPRPLDDCLSGSRAILRRAVVEIPDVFDDATFLLRDRVVGVPLMSRGEPIGSIAVGRPEPGRFPDAQIAMLRTFAEQAVIAIENARLVRELAAHNRDLAEALEQQTATSEILRVIAQSPADVQPVFDTIARAAMRLCNAGSANVFTFDGELLRIGTIVVANAAAEATIRRIFPRPPDRGSAASRAVLMRQVVAIDDVLLDPDYASRDVGEVGFRSVVGVPLLRDGEPIGAIAIGKSEPGLFPPQQVELLQTFASQAVIAIENARLLRELRARTAELTQSLAELRVLGEVGQAVGSTLDLETVLRTIVSRATGLAGVEGGAMFEYDADREEFRLRTADGLPDDLVAALAAAPMAKGEGVIGRLALTGAPAAVADIGDESVYRSRVRDILLRHGYRSLLAVPLLREDRVLGGLVVNRRQAGEFPPRVIELLQTFATQSALAIQNARLYRELEDKGRQLEIASRHKSRFLASMSHELRTPLNAMIGFTRIVMRRTKETIDEKQYENLEKIFAAAQHLLSLINAVLDLAKVEAGKVEVQAGEVDAAQLLEQCLRTVEPLARDGVALQRDFAGQLPSLWTDGEKLRQIVINLLSNAAKFTAAGVIRVSARAGADGVAIAVADTGTGIPADRLESVFEEFEQVETSGARAQGTGLGLAISRRLARLMGGDLQAESRLGEGSTFTLTLPIRYRAERP
jgi:signal transduction histidine kinase/putative methionine-R-sulfoxide reductase with GAF domain